MFGGYTSQAVPLSKKFSGWSAEKLYAETKM